MKIFEVERDNDCRAYIISATTDIPVGYDGHPGHPGRPIMQLMITDRVKHFLINLWRSEDERNRANSEE